MSAGFTRAGKPARCSNGWLTVVNALINTNKRRASEIVDLILARSHDIQGRQQQSDIPAPAPEPCIAGAKPVRVFLRP